MFVTCTNCKKQKPNTAFLVLEDHPLTAPNGQLLTCISCLTEEIEDYKDLDSVSRLFQVLDLAFYPEEWIQLGEEYQKNPFVEYLNLYHRKGYAKKGKWDELSKIWGAKLDEGSAPREIPELQAKHLSDLQLKWRGEYSYNNYLWLERYEKKMKDQYAIETMDEEDKLYKIAKISLQIDLALDSGEPTKDLIASYDKLLTSANFQPASSRDGSVSSISELADFIETKGYVPKFHFSTPKDIVDATIKDLQNFYVSLVDGEPNLSDIVAQKKQTRLDRAGIKIETIDEKRFEAIGRTAEEMTEEEYIPTPQDVDEVKKEQLFTLEELNESQEEDPIERIKKEILVDELEDTPEALKEKKRKEKKRTDNERVKEKK